MFVLVGQDRGPGKMGGGIAGERPVTEAARLLRADLAKTFPSQRFCVTVEKYSLGESINVRWVDGPSTVRVERVVDRYGDIDRDPFTGEILSGGNRFAFASRRYSPAIFDAAHVQFEAGQLPGFASAWHKLSTTDYPQVPFRCVRGLAVDGDFKQMVKVGDLICPRIGSVKNITSRVTSVGRISVGSRELGTKAGELFVLAVPELPPQLRGIVWLRRQDFVLGRCRR